jgi:hypothetical protein
LATAVELATVKIQTTILASAGTPTATEGAKNSMDANQKQGCLQKQ